MVGGKGLCVWVVAVLVALIATLSPPATDNAWIVRPLAVRAINHVGSFDGVRRHLAFLAAIDEESLKQQAVRDSGGFDDFGEDMYPMSEGLSALVKSLNQDTTLSFIGAVIARRILVQHLTQRLQIVGEIRKNPAILKQDIDSPIIIVGAPRTGSTFLYHLMDADESNRSPLFWELLKPWPAPNASQTQSWGSDWRIWMCDLELFFFKFLIPNVDSLHRFGGAIPSEEIILHSQQFKSFQWPTVFDVPSYSDFMIETLPDQERFLHYHRDALKYFQHGGMPPNSKRWLLKTPDHLPRVRELMKTYPNAKIVWTHRNPANVVSSIASLSCFFIGVVQDNVDHVRIGNKWLDVMTATLTKATQDRKGMTPEENARVYDVQFGDLLDDPVGQVEKIYRYFDISMTSKTKADLTAFAQEHKHGSKGKHKHSVSTFGWSKSQLETRFKTYIDFFNIST